MPDASSDGVSAMTNGLPGTGTGICVPEVTSNTPIRRLPASMASKRPRSASDAAVPVRQEMFVSAGAKFHDEGDVAFSRPERARGTLTTVPEPSAAM